jgi:hypothetical protein
VPLVSSLLATGVDPNVKAAALDALSALATPLPPPDGNSAPSAEIAVEVWRALQPSSPTSSGQPQNIMSPYALNGTLAPPSDPDTENSTGPDVLEGIKGDLPVEHRHQRYPQTRAFLRLLLTIARAHADAGMPPPAGMAGPLLWAAESIFALQDGFGFITQVREGYGGRGGGVR